MNHIIFGLAAIVLLTGCAIKMPQTSDGSDNMQLKILHYRQPCQGVGIQLCYLVGENVDTAEFFYNSIEGFEYEWGYNYTLLVEKRIIDKPMADASSFSFRLIKQISKEKVSADLHFELPLVVNGHSLVKSDGGDCLYFGSVRINTGEFSCDSLSSYSKGVFQHADGELRLLKVL